MKSKISKTRKNAFRLIPAFILAAVLMSVTGCVYYVPVETGNGTGLSDIPYTEREADLLSSSGEENGKILLRFYENMPDIPYIGIAEYKKLVNHENITVEAKDGYTVLTAEDGSVITADPEAGTLTSEQFAQFRNDEKGMLEGKEISFSDFNTPFIRIESIDYEPADKPTVLAPGAYGIPLYADENDAYLPLCTVSNLMVDAAYNILLYNGENVCLRRGFFDRTEGIDPDYYKQFYDNTPRNKETIDFDYAQLCFVMDNTYGCPEKTYIDRILKEKGFDRTLTETDEITAEIKEMLLSADQNEYLAGLIVLQAYFFDGHTMLLDNDLCNGLMDEGLLAGPLETAQELIDKMRGKEYYESLKEALYSDPSVARTREEIFGDTETYHSKGDTAVITINDFMSYDEEGWLDHYENGGDLPDPEKTGDIVMTLMSGLERAKADPEIKNVILDLSDNTGGSSNILMFVMSVITGKADFNCVDKVTGQYYTIHYAADTLFDGSFDTAAAFESMDYNFAMLITRNSFSCGNAAPELAKEAGIPLFGERSGGGSCMISALVLSDGEIFTISTGFGGMIDQNRESVESGIPVDMELVHKDDNGEKDYSKLYDIDGLSGLMEEWEEFALPAAA
ncbi:MAG: hypothetical protein K5886_08690 [Lachnospiraceae bacterium]|nr:hypothetical protein [Lachnospiraceae bacterium]